MKSIVLICLASLALSAMENNHDNKGGKNDDVTAEIDEAADNFPRTVEDLEEIAGYISQALLDEIKNEISQLPKRDQHAIREIVEDVLDAVRKALYDVEDQAEEIEHDLEELADNSGSDTHNFLQVYDDADKAKSFSQDVNQTADNLPRNIDDLEQIAGYFSQALLDDIKYEISQLPEGDQKAIRRIVEAILDAVRGILGDVSNAAEEVSEVDRALEGLNDNRDNQDGGNRNLNFIQNSDDRNPDDLSQEIDDVEDGFPRTVEDLEGIAGYFSQALLDEIKNEISQLPESDQIAIRDIVQAVLDSVRSILYDIEDDMGEIDVDIEKLENDDVI